MKSLKWEEGMSGSPLTATRPTTGASRSSRLKEVVTITRAGNLIRVSPGLLDLYPVLTYKRRSQVDGNPRNAIYEEVELFEKESDGSLIAPSGLTTRICKFVREKLKMEVKFNDMREVMLPEPDYEKIPPLRGHQFDAIAAIITSDCGIIEAPTGAGKSFVIRVLCRIWSKAKIIICSPFTSLLHQAKEELKKVLADSELGMVGDGYKELDRRVTLTTDRSLINCDLEGCRIFIFDEVHRAASPVNAQIIASIRNARMLGFSASPYGRSDKADLETEALFGPRICKISYQDVQSEGSIVPIKVLTYSCERLPTVDIENINALERHGLWRNTKRNQLIAKAVEDIKRRSGDDAQIMISVKTIEHAVYLRKWLPDFTLVYASMNPERRRRWIKNGLLSENHEPLDSEKREELRSQFSSGKLRRVIATGTWSTGVDFPHLNALIRADGQAGTIPNTQIPGRVTRASAGKCEGYVVDFDDSFNGTLNRRSLKRLALYKKKGWEIEWVLQS